MDWKRVIGWSIVAIFSTYAIALLSGVLTGVIIARSDTNPATVYQIAVNGGIIRRVAVGIAVTLCYWRLGAGASRNRIAHIVSAFVLIRATDLVISVLLGASSEMVLQPQGHLWAALWALAGYLLAWLASNRAFSAKLPGGSKHQGA